MFLWHGDWKLFRLENIEYWLIAFIDDRFRLITCHGVYDSPTAANTVKVLRKGFDEYGVHDAVVTDNGTQFTAVNSKRPYNHIFARFLRVNNVKHISGRPSHPQTNGKIERFFEEVELRIKTQFKSIEEIVKWQNEMKTHTALNYKRPIEIFNSCLTPERILGYAMRWFYEA